MSAEGLRYLASATVEEKLLSYAQKKESSSHAHIVGVTCKDTLALLDLSLLPADTEGVPQGADGQFPLPGCTASWLPQGLAIVGFGIIKASQDQSGAARLEAAQAGQKRRGKASVYAVAENGAITYWSTGTPPQPLTVDVQTPEATRSWLDKHLCLLRLQLPLKVQVHAERSEKAWSSALDSAFQSLHTRLDLNTVVFLVNLPKQQGKFILGGGKGITQIEDVYGNADSPINIALLQPTQANTSSTPTISYEPHEGGPCTISSAILHLDFLIYTSRESQLSSLSSPEIQSAIRRQLQGAKLLLRSNPGISAVSAMHFQPPGSSHCFMFLFPLPSKNVQDAQEQDKSVVALRRHLHTKLLLPMDRPLLRSWNAVNFGVQQGKAGPQLLDVHKGLKPSGVKGGKAHLIWGTYSYFHYMQDGMNDSGWGCAYRSLQTICSWFRHQHMTSKPIPTHREIQQALVDIGDKERSFVGSKQWIGAIEIGFVIETLLGVIAKVITVSKGADIDQKARELANHFDRQGTPVMIGGGVLAYTLLGIDYNEATGECAYLILDPHYAGQDDLKKIQNAQWVAWKKSDSTASAGGKLFVQDAFYNLLCPQRSSSI